MLPSIKGQTVFVLKKNGGLSDRLGAGGQYCFLAQQGNCDILRADLSRQIGTVCYNSYNLSFKMGLCWKGGGSADSRQDRIGQQQDVKG